MVEICGVEEAGRGPVIGPMVMAGVVVDKEKEQQLADMGIKDSKMLTPMQRERLFDLIKETVKRYEIIVLSAQDVDDALNDPEINLNWLEAITSATLIDNLKAPEAILDCPSSNPPAYKDYVLDKLKNRDVKIIAEHKADVNYPVVAAASILAKVTRDREIEKMKDKINIDFGSGYPSDPKTVAFLKKYYEEHKELFRTTWKSYKKVAEAKMQKNLDFY